MQYCLKHFIKTLTYGAMCALAGGLFSIAFCCSHTMLGDLLIQKPERKINLVYPAVAKIFTYDHNCVELQELDQIRMCLAIMPMLGDRGAPSGGAAFWLSKNHIVSAQHVALYADADPESVLIMSNGGFDYAKAKVKTWAFYGDVDLAIGYVEDPPEHEILDLCDDTFEGEAATIHGYPIDTGYETAKAVVIGHYKHVLILAARIRGGYSGGPVVSDARKCVMGMAIQAAPASRPPAAIAVTIRDIRTFTLQIYNAKNTTPSVSKTSG